MQVDLRGAESRYDGLPEFEPSSSTYTSASLPNTLMAARSGFGEQEMGRRAQRKSPPSSSAGFPFQRISYSYLGSRAIILYGEYVWLGFINICDDYGRLRVVLS